MAIYLHHDGIAILMPPLFFFCSWILLLDNETIFLSVSTHDKYLLLNNDDIEMQHIQDTEKLSDNED